MIKPRSIQARVALSTFVCWLAIIAVIAVVVDRHVYDAAIDVLDDEMDPTVRGLLGRVWRDEDGFALQSGHALARQFDSPQDHAYWQLLVDGQTVIASASLAGLALPIPDAALVQAAADSGRRRPYRDVVEGPGGDALRLWASPVAGFPGVTLLVAEDMDEVEHTVEEVREALVVALPLALLLGTLASFLVAGRATRPIASMTRDAQAIRGAESDARLDVASLDGELRDLGDTINAAFDRQAAAIERERRFTADASHELRTPLTVLRANVELALARERSPAEYRAALQDVLVVATDLSQLAESLLLLARAEERSFRCEPVDLRLVALAAAEQLTPLAAASQSSFSLDVASLPVLVSGNEVLLIRLLANLLENALRHGGSRRPIEVLARGDGERVMLRVRDHGPGFPADLLPRVFERFARSDPSRTRGTGGVGLGLAIVRAIARAHGGEAVAGNHRDGGAEVVVDLQGG